MGFLSKLMKNPLMQAIAPIALTAAMGPTAGWMGKWGMFKNMSPLMANALKQSALGFGTAALSGSKRPWKGAMYAGLTSIPFSYMSAANAANQFNQQYAGQKGLEKYMISPENPKNPIFEQVDFEQGFGIPERLEQPATWGFRPKGKAIAKVSPWDIMTGKTRSAQIPPMELISTDEYDPLGVRVGDPSEKYKSGFAKLGSTETVPFDADIFTKQVPIEGAPGYYDTKTNWIPTAAAQAAALYGGRDTPEEEWEASKRKRRKELAWMYGVPEDMIEGEMDNPWYTGSGLFNAGGIASLDMSYGGDVSGPGGPKDDMIDAKLSDGEFVMTAKAVENFGGGDRYEGARKMYQMMNMLDPQSETMSEVV
tara:strand:- start:10195 stop:11292 length:1098 start_codon:yes stop_codon:yes gene_type:complete